MIRLALLALLVSTTVGCAGAPRSFTPGAGRVQHTVVFYLTSDAPEGTAAAVAEFYRGEVPKLPGVESVFVGGPRQSERSVVDDGFSLCTSTVFVDSAAEQAWQVHPIHDELKRRFERYFERVVVYDILE